MNDAVWISPSDKWGHGNDIFRIVVLDGAQIAKFSCSCGLIGNDIRSLNVCPLVSGLLADEVNFSCLKLADGDGISHSFEMVVDDILNNLFYIPFSSCPQSFPASGSFPVSQLFASGGQSMGASASVSVLPMNIQGWFPLGLTGLIPLKSKGLSKVSLLLLLLLSCFSCVRLCATP